MVRDYPITLILAGCNGQFKVIGSNIDHLQPITIKLSSCCIKKEILFLKNCKLVGQSYLSGNLSNKYR
jgi:hypothetical protein